MNAIIASFVGAMILGAADFCGGLASKRLRVALVGLVGQAIGLFVVLAVITVFSVPLAERALLYGVGAGGFGGLALLTLYKGLAVGRVAVVAPVSAVLGAAIPVLYSLLTGTALNALSWSAIGLGLIAVYLLSVHGEESLSTSGSSGFNYGLISGACVGGFFVMLGHPEAHGNIWALLGERTTIIVMFMLLILFRRGGGEKVDRETWALVAIGGTCDITANLLYLWSSAHGPLHMVALLTSMYPASTVLLGCGVLKERLNKRIVIGAAFALGSIALFALQQ